MAAQMSQGAISNYETRLRASSRRVLKLAAVLNVNPLWLAEGVGPAEPTAPLPFTLQDSRQAHDNQRMPGPTWPFERLTPSEFYSLSAEQRRAIEEVAIAWLKPHPTQP